MCSIYPFDLTIWKGTPLNLAWNRLGRLVGWRVGKEVLHRRGLRTDRMGESKRFLFKKETGQELEMGDDLILREMSLIEGKALDVGGGWQVEQRPTDAGGARIQSLPQKRHLHLWRQRAGMRKERCGKLENGERNQLGTRKTSRTDPNAPEGRKHRSSIAHWGGVLAGGQQPLWTTRAAGGWGQGWFAGGVVQPGLNWIVSCV